MKDYTYEVRGVNDPIDGEVVRFHSKQEALEYSDEMKSLYPDNTVYMVEWDFDDEFGFDGAPTKTQEIQIRGPEVDANLADPTVPNSCDGDNPDNYDEEGNFRLPTFNDGLDDDIAEEDTDEGLVGAEDIPVEEGFLDDFKFEPFPCVNEIWEFAKEEPVDGIYKLVKTQEYKYDPELDGPRNTITRRAENSFRQRPNAAFVVSRNLKNNEVKVIQWSKNIFGKDLNPIGMSAEDQEAISNQFKTMFVDDDIENESFAEDLFNALSTKRSEEVFPKGDLDLEAPHKDVPVVDCDVNPVITHSEDEKPLNENK